MRPLEAEDLLYFVVLLIKMSRAKSQARRRGAVSHGNTMVG